MKMKFRLFATLLMAALCVSFMSCKSDEGKEIQSDKTLDLLVGSWEIIVTNPDPIAEKAEPKAKNEYSIVWTFNSDKTYSYYFGLEDETETGIYNYYPDSKTLTYGVKSKLYTITILEISDQKLIIDRAGVVEEYNRKK